MGKDTLFAIIDLNARGVARIFQRVGHTVSKQGRFNYGQDIVMAFSPPVEGCLVKKGLQEGGSRAPQAPLATPLYAFLEALETCLIKIAPLSETLGHSEKYFFSRDNCWLINVYIVNYQPVSVA